MLSLIKFIKIKLSSFFTIVPFRLKGESISSDVTDHLSLVHEHATHKDN